MHSLANSACMWGWSSTVKLLLQNGAEANAKNSVGRTPIMFAVEFLHEQLAELLAYDKRVQINTGDIEGVTPLMLAVESGDDGLGILEKLLVAGADPEQETTKRKTALWFACKAQNLKAINVLLNHNCKRKPEAFALLTGDAAKEIQLRLRREEAEQKLADEQAQKIAEAEGTTVAVGAGYRNRSHYGAWVEYIDKRGGGPFYYNPVTRVSQWKKPGDFKVDKKRAAKLATFGMSFYH